MARGKRTSLAGLGNAVGNNSPVDQYDADPPRRAPLTDLTPNPHNPRDDLGDLADLASIADMQLQPVVAVTTQAYLRLYPDAAIPTRFVVVNGCRRLAAAHKYGRSDLDFVVNDAIARDRITLISASIAENVDRQDFDVIEEARAVEALVEECESADEAAARLHRTAGWVSQRRALLQLIPELQAALRRGEIALREARSLARVPTEQQVARWRAKSQGSNPPPAGKGPVRSRSRVVTDALGKFDAEPELLAEALRTYLGDDGVKTLLAALTSQPTATP
ncbi:MAG: ParB/RepB/Spo0J family partition protein [Mycolicibacterium sp.]|uniref:ParB/RepB/Spo0J family partition protein n=1 Tax=Mycolicibacterium sp. TaxID=2320850 RepID=UPI003D12074E